MIASEKYNLLQAYFTRLVRQKYPYIVFFLVSLIPFWINVSSVPQDAVLNLRDFDTPIEIDFDLYVRSFSWNSNWGLGLPYSAASNIPSKNLFFSFLNLFGLPLIYIEKIYLTCILFLLGCTAYYFVTNYFRLKENYKRLCGLIAGLFYMFNIPVYTRFIGVPHILVSVALYPVLCILILKAIYSDNLKSVIRYGFCFALVSLFALSGDPSLIACYVPLVLLLVFLHILIDRKKLNFKIVSSALVLILFLTLLANLCWLTPIIEGLLASKTLMKETIAHPHNKEVFESANNLVSFFDNIRLHWTKKGFYLRAPDGTPYFTPGYIKNFYNWRFSYILFLIFLAFSIYISFKNQENRKQIFVITLVGLTSTFFSLGTHFPVFGQIHEFLFYNMPGFQVLRNFYKFQYLVLIWYVSLITLLCSYLFCRFGQSKKNVVVILSSAIVFIILNSLPLFTKNLAGRHEFFKVPDYYVDARFWLNKQDKDIHRILVIPQGTWEETYKWGPKFELVPIHRNFFKDSILLLQEPDDTYKLIKPIEEFEIDNLSRYLSLLNIRYILVRKDIYKPNLTRKNKDLIKKLPGVLEKQGIILDKSFGDLDFYKIPAGNVRPHIYPSADLTLITGDSNSLVPLAHTTYLDGLPAFCLTDQQSKDSLLVSAQGANQILAANKNFIDLVIDMAVAKGQFVLVKLNKKGKTNFKTEDEGFYEIWARNIEVLKDTGCDGEVTIDDKALQSVEQQMQTAKLDNRKWIKVAELKLDKNEHEISVNNNNDKLEGGIQELDFVVAHKEKMEEYKNTIAQKLNGYLFYVDREKIEDMLNDKKKRGKIKLEGENPFGINRRQFYLSEDGRYTLKTLIKPKRDFLMSESINSVSGSVKTSIDVVSGWDIKPLNTTFRQTISEDGLHIDAYFHQNADTVETVILTKKFNSIKIKERPYFVFSCDMKDPKVQELEIIIKLTDPGETFSLFRTKKLILKPDNKQYIINLYKMAFDVFRKRAIDNLVVEEVVISLKKKEGVDLSSEVRKKQSYTFIFRNIAFLKARPVLYEFDDKLAGYVSETIYSSYELISKFLIEYVPDTYHYFDIDGNFKNVDFLDQVPQYVKDVYKLDINKSVDLKKDPVLTLKLNRPIMSSLIAGEREDFPNEWVIILSLDLDGDGKEDNRIETSIPVSGPAIDKLLLVANVYEEVKKRFSNEKKYDLVYMGLRYPEDEEVLYHDVVSKRLVRYREHIYTPSDFEVGARVLEIDGNTFQLQSVAKRQLKANEAGQWIEFENVYLKEGDHILKVFESDKFVVEMVEVRLEAKSGDLNPASQKLPRVDFKKINPTRYVVDVKDAKEPFTLVFSESFHEGWQAYIRPKVKEQESWVALWSAWEDRAGKNKIKIKEHFIANGYANGWVVQTGAIKDQRSKIKINENDFQIVLEYKPQRLFELGVIISAITLLGCISYLIYDLYTRK